MSLLRTDYRWFAGIIFVILPVVFWSSPAAGFDGESKPFVQFSATALTITPPHVSNLLTLTVRIMRPDDGLALDARTAGNPIIWSLTGAEPDGYYRYEAVAILRQAQDEPLRKENGSSVRFARAWGVFKVEGGLLVPLREPSRAQGPGGSEAFMRLLAGLLDRVISVAQAADLFAENPVPVVIFDDTEDETPDPTRDWTFGCDGGTSDGDTVNSCYLEDKEHGDFPLYIWSTGSSNMSVGVMQDGDVSLAGGAFYVDRSAARVGIGTTGPLAPLHIVATQPGIIFHDNASVQWQMYANSLGLDVWDMTADTSPLHIGAGAPDGSIYIEGSTGDVGIGTASPSDPLHVTRSDGNAKVLVEETNASVAPRTLFELKNAGNTKFTINNTNAGVQWAFTNSGTDFRVSRQGSGVVEMALDNSGNMTIQGTLTQLSSRAVKHDIKVIDAAAVLSKVVALPIARWRYRDDRQGARHLGPMAEDFAAAFGLGATNEGISTLDTSGVALAAIQGLKAEKDAEIVALRAAKDTEIAALRSELLAIKRMVERLATKGKVASTSTQ